MAISMRYTGVEKLGGEIKNCMSYNSIGSLENNTIILIVGGDWNFLWEIFVWFDNCVYKLIV